jgi:hypothetical protein
MFRNVLAATLRHLRPERLHAAITVLAHTLRVAAARPALALRYE